MISFEVDDKTDQLIKQVIEKIANTDYLAEIAKNVHGKDWRLGVHMDLTAVHSNGCPMNWARYFDGTKGADTDFAHDIGGILNLLNRGYDPDEDDEELDDGLFFDQFWWPRAAIS